MSMVHRCHLCQRVTTDFPAFDKRLWACKPCWKDYVAYRRAFKAEHGRYPTVAEFREDEA